MRNPLQLHRIWLPFLAVGISGYMGYYIAQRGGLNTQQLTAISLGLVVGGLLLHILLTQQERHRTQVLIWLPLLWLLGVRGADIYGSIELFAPQVGLYALALTLFVQRTVSGQRPRLWQSPMEVGLLFVVGAGALSAVVNGIRSDVWMQDVLSFGTTWAAFFCVYNLELQPADFKKLFLVLTMVWTFVAISGLTEMALGVGQTNYVPGQIGFGATTFIRPEETGFVRVSYFYWGGYVAATLMLLALPLAMAALYLVPTSGQRGWVILAVGLCVIGVAVSGYRGLWIAGIAVIGLAVLFNRRAAVWSLLAAGALVVSAPLSYYARFLSIFSGQIDSSAVDRLNRSQIAWNLALRNPLLGAGWGASGWVHNDLLQITADAGFLAAATFVGLVAWLAFRLIRSANHWPVLSQPQNAEWRWLALGLGLSLVAGLLAMLSQTFIVTPIVMSQFALLLAMAHRMWELLQAQFEPAKHPVSREQPR